MQARTRCDPASKGVRCRSTCGSESSAAPRRRTRCRSGLIAPTRFRVNLADLERVFDDGAEVTLEALLDKRLIRNTRTDVKILGNGELKKKLTVTAHRFSKTAAEKIEAAGGTATALRPPREVKRRAPKKLKPRSRPTRWRRLPPTSRAAAETEPAEPENAGASEENGEAEAPESEG